MSCRLIAADDVRAWRDVLEKIPRIDVCQLPEYHSAYATRIKNSRPILWVYEEGGNVFAYPFLLAPVEIVTPDQQAIATPYQDISSIYGYSGPLSSTKDKDFIKRAWAVFDQWGREEKIIAEFIRFSLFADTKENAHADMTIEYNRPAAVTVFPETEEELMVGLGSKTRNMIRKAIKTGLELRELNAAQSMESFRALYGETMDRNNAPDFFYYDDVYYDLLLSLPKEELRLFGVYEGDKLVSAAMALCHGEGALYHLGASLEAYAKSGAGNLAMFGMSKGLMGRGVKFLHIGGGRTTGKDDPLFRFKRSNAMGEMDYCIGKSIVDPEGYREVVKIWERQYKSEPDTSKLLFYR
jgi:CelD/BcsL family acetyltransferase involved in cellulose biosynthesis